MKDDSALHTQLLPYLLVAPAVVLILSFLAYPIARVLYLSFQNYDLTRVRKNGFARSKNYQKLLHDGELYSPPTTTVKWILTQVVGQLVLGTVAVLLLNQEFKDRGFVRAISLVPWAVSGMLAIILRTLMYDQSSDLTSDMLIKSGIISKKAARLIDSRAFFPAVNIAELWRGVPFSTINTLAALQSIPTDVHESSAIDGCGPVKSFFYITFPYLEESIIFIAFLRGIQESNSIDMIFAMTDGGLMDRTTILPIYMIKIAIIKGSYGYGSTIRVIAFLILLMSVVFYIKASGFGDEEDE